MKTFTMKRDTWHYKMAVIGRARFDTDGNIDFCSYLSAVFQTALVGLLVIFLGLIVAYPIVSMFMGIAFSLYYGLWIFTEAGIAGIVITTAIGMIAVMVMISRWAETKKEQSRLNPQEPGFFRLAYNKFKDKACVKITFERSQND